MFDCAVFGAFGAFVSYRLVPTVVLTTGILTAVTGVGGLPLFVAGVVVLFVVLIAGMFTADFGAVMETGLVTMLLSLAVAFLFQLLLAFQRSEERRVGKECRSLWALF